jgi:hypothetical protein
MARRTPSGRQANDLTSENNGLKVDGVRATAEWLGLMGTPDAALKAANNEAANIVANQAKRDAKFKGVSTGRLVRSIKPSSTVTTAIVRAGSASVPYAGPIHWGWLYDKQYQVYKNISPNPFLAKALGYNRDVILATYKEQVEKLAAQYKPKKPR